MTPAYAPGTCNIGPREIRKRLTVGYVGLGATVLLIAFFLLSDAARFWRITIFIPAFVAALGFLQSRQRFCVYYGMVGIENTHDGTPKKVDNPVDKGQAMTMLLQSFFLAAMVMLLLLIIR